MLICRRESKTQSITDNLATDLGKGAGKCTDKLTEKLDIGEQDDMEETGDQDEGSIWWKGGIKA